MAAKIALPCLSSPLLLRLLVAGEELGPKLTGNLEITSGDAEATSSPEMQKEGHNTNYKLKHVVTAETTARKYHSLFPEIPLIASKTMIQETCSSTLPKSNVTSSHPGDCESRTKHSNQKSSHWKYDGRDVLLVDVRTPQEQRVSMIAGAVTLGHFKSEFLPIILEKSGHPDEKGKLSDQSHSYTKLDVKEDGRGNDAIPTPCSNPEMIVMYCTVGYRSGMEARKLKNDFPSLFNDDNEHERNGAKLKIGNLDGIVNFANSNMDIAISNYYARDQLAVRSASNSLLVNPKTQQPTMRVHVYGTPWKSCISPEVHEIVTFSKLDFLLKSVRVVFRNFIVSCKSCWK